MVEQPPSSTTRELAEYLSRQFDRLTTAVFNGVAGATQTFSRLALDGVWDAASGKAQLFLNGAIGNRIEFNGNGPAAPSFTTRSTGTRLAIVPLLSGTTVADVAIGYEPNALWFGMSTVNPAHSFKWYGGTTLAAQLTSDGNLSAIGSILSSSTTGGVGYGAGSRGTVTQLTSKVTTVILNAVCGTITTSNSALTANQEVGFQLTNSTIGVNDVVIVNPGTSTNINAGYAVRIGSSFNGGTAIMIKNLTAGTLSDILVINFAVIKGG
jgi:hypothetical protein